MPRGLLIGFVGVAGVLSAGPLVAAPPASTSGEATTQVKAEIQAGLPAYGESEKAPPPPQADPQDLEMRSHIKRLPRAPLKPPQGEEILTAKGKADAAMNEYLGQRDGLTRGVLDRYNLPQLWQKIPLLHYLPCPLPGISNETWALYLKSDAEYSGALREATEFNALDGSGPRTLSHSNLDAWEHYNDSSTSP